MQNCSENTWHEYSILAGGNILVYTTSKIIICAHSTSVDTTVCTFTNRLGNVRQATVRFNIISGMSLYFAMGIIEGIITHKWSHNEVKKKELSNYKTFNKQMNLISFICASSQQQVLIF